MLEQNFGGSLLEKISHDQNRNRQNRNRPAGKRSFTPDNIAANRRARVIPQPGRLGILHSCLQRGATGLTVL